MPGDFAAALHQARKNAGLTQRQAAERTDIPLSSYQSYEQGKADPPYERAQAILEALGAGGGDTGAAPFYLVLRMNGQPFYRFRCVGETLGDVELDVALDASTQRV